MSTSLDETSTQMSMAETFKGRNTAKTGDELKKARESRAAEALRMKDDQLRILAEQNAKLLASLDKVYINKVEFGEINIQLTFPSL